MDWLVFTWERPDDSVGAHFYTIYESGYPVASLVEPEFEIRNDTCGSWTVTITNLEGKESLPTHQIITCIWEYEWPDKPGSKTRKRGN